MFSAARSQRPGAFRNPKDATPKESCPFCEGHETMTPPEVLAYRVGGKPDGPGWSIRCVPNKFPALERVGEVREHREGPFVSVDGVGAHEIVVESPDHDGHLATLDDRQIEQVLRAYRERYHDLAADRRIKYVQIFKNHGERAGASYSHAHSQIIAIPIVPLRILEELEGVRAHSEQRDGECLFYEILRHELGSGQRVVAENGAFVALEPFAARFPFETWLLPKVHARAFETLSDSDRQALARILKDVLGRTYRMLDNPSFNYYVHPAPVREPRGHVPLASRNNAPPH